MIAAAVFAAAAVVLPASARVFRIVGDAGNQLNTDLLPWSKAYKTQMDVNGRKNRLFLYSARYTEPVVEQLRAGFEQLGAKVQISQTPDGATGSAKWHDGEARFLVVSPSSEPRHLIFIFYPEDSAGRSPALPVPEYPRGKVVSTVANDQTGTMVATVETTDSTTDVHTFYADTLLATGWKMAAPATVGNGRISGLAVYTKEKKICYVQATERPGRSNMITLLVKGGAI